VRSFHEYSNDFEEAQQDLLFIVEERFQIKEAEKMHEQALQLTEGVKR
jgi:hypothetical protein